MNAQQPATATNLAAMRQQQAAPREAQIPTVRAGFFDLQAFELIQRVSKAFATSDLVPKNYQGNLANCMIAMDMAQRIGANPLMVMQNLYIVHGTPGWSSKFLIATINASGRYSSLRYEWKDKPGEAGYGCRAWAIERETGERLDGIWVTWEMVKSEGWDAKNGSKWKTMPDQMFVYRCAAFWQRAYAPELGMGLQTVEDINDTFDATRSTDGSFSVELESMRKIDSVAPDGTAIDQGTGEIINQNPTTGSAAQAADGTTSQKPLGTPTLTDALSSVRKGDFDLARDLARGLSESEVETVEQAIANREGQGQKQRPRRPMNVE